MACDLEDSQGHGGHDDVPSWISNPMLQCRYSGLQTGKDRRQVGEKEAEEADEGELN